MPDGQGNYQGDWATILPSNIQNIIHYGDAYALQARQAQADKEKAAAEKAKRMSDLYGLIPKEFDPSKYTDQNPYTEATGKDLMQMRQKYATYLSDNYKKGTEPDEGQFRSDMDKDLQRVSGNYMVAGQKSKEIQEKIKEYEKEPGVDKKALLKLSLDQYFNTKNEKGEKAMIPEAWDRNKSGTDVVQEMMDKFPELIFTGEGTDDQIRGWMKKDPVREIDEPTITDPNTGRTTKTGYKAKINSFQEIVPADGKMKVDIRTELITLPDGTEYRTVAKDLKEQTLAEIGIGGEIKTKLKKVVAEENQRRQKNNEVNGGILQPMTDEEIDILSGDLVLEKLRKNMPPSGVNIKETNDFDNALKLKNYNLAAQGRSLAERKFAWDKAKGSIDDNLFRDIFKEIEAKAKMARPGKDGMAFNSLSSTAQSVLVDYANSVAGTEDKKFTQRDLYIKAAGGKIYLMQAYRDEGGVVSQPGSVISEINFTDANSKVNPSKGEREEMLKAEPKKGFIQRTVGKVKEALTGKKQSTITGLAQGDLD